MAVRCGATGYRIPQPPATARGKSARSHRRTRWRRRAGSAWSSNAVRLCSTQRLLMKNISPRLQREFGAAPAGPARRPERRGPAPAVASAARRPSRVPPRSSSAGSGTAALARSAPAPGSCAVGASPSRTPPRRSKWNGRDNTSSTLGRLPAQAVVDRVTADHLAEPARIAPGTGRGARRNRERRRRTNCRCGSCSRSSSPRSALLAPPAGRCRARRRAARPRRSGPSARRASAPPASRAPRSPAAGRRGRRSRDPFPGRQVSAETRRPMRRGGRRRDAVPSADARAGSLNLTERGAARVGQGVIIPAAGRRWCRRARPARRPVWSAWSAPPHGPIVVLPRTSATGGAFPHFRSSAHAELPI